MAAEELIQVGRPNHSWRSRVVSLACRPRRLRNDRQIICGNRERIVQFDENAVDSDCLREGDMHFRLTRHTG